MRRPTRRPPRSRPIETVATEVVAALGLSLAHERRPAAEGAAVPTQTHVTVLGSPLRPGAMATIARTVAECGGNIENIERLAAYPVTAIELHVSGADQQVLRTRLAAEAADAGIDVAVQPAGLHRRAKRLVVMDVDSTLIQGEVIEMLAKHAGCEPEVAAITRAAMTRGDGLRRVTPASRPPARRTRRRSARCRGGRRAS